MTLFRPLTLVALLLLVGCPSKDDGESPAEPTPSSAHPTDSVAAAESTEPSPAPDENEPPATAKGSADAAPAQPSAPGEDVQPKSADSDAVPDSDVPKKKDSGPPRDLQVLPKSWSRKKVNDYMKKQVNRGLGVKCKHCHDTKDYAADGKKDKEVSREMIVMQDRINKEFFAGKQVVTCFTCHKGKLEIPK